MLKKTLSIILAVAMLCTVIPSVAFATETETVEEAVVETVAETLAEEPELELLASHDFDVQKLLNQFDPGVPMPQTFANYGYNNSTELDSFIGSVSTAALPQNSITYMLIDSDNAQKSNFEGQLADGTGWQPTVSNMANPWLAGVNTRRSNTGDRDMSKASTHTAYIVVPESVGEQGRDFQIVTSAIYTPLPNGNDPSPAAFANRGICVWVDDVMVEAECGNGQKHIVLGHAFKASHYNDSGLTSWTVGSTYNIWAWGPTVTLTPGIHKVVYKPNGSPNAGRTPGLIITDALGYDWTKVFPFSGGVQFTESIPKSQQSIAKTFGASGANLIDFAAPSFADTDVASAVASAKKATISWPAATDASGNGYGDEFVGYIVEYDGKTVETLDTTVTLSGLALGTDYSATITPIDAVGNKGAALTCDFTTLSSLPYPYFEDGAEIINVMPSDATEEEKTTTLQLEWTPAVTTNNAEIGYTVYLNNNLKAQNQSATSLKIMGLTPGSQYDVRIEVCADGVEVNEDESVRSATFYTEAPVTASCISTTTDSAVIEISNNFIPAEDYDVEYTVSANGSHITPSVSGNQLTINGLVDGTKQMVYIQAVGTHKATKAEKIVTYPAVEVTTASAPATPTFAAGLPIMYHATATTWPANATNSPQGEDWFDPATEIFYANNNQTATYTLNVPEDGNYYIAIRSNAYLIETARSLTISIDGTTVTKDGTNPFRFGYDGGTERQKYVISYNPRPVHLTAGAHNVVATASSSVLRVGFIAFIPANDEATVKETLNKIQSKEDVEALVNPTAYLTSSSVTTAVLSSEQIIVKWIPSFIADGDTDAAYEIYLNDNLVYTAGPDERKYVINQGVQTGTNTIKVVAKSGLMEKGEVTVSVRVETAVTSAVTSNFTPVLDDQGNPTDVYTTNQVAVALDNPTTTAKTLRFLVCVYRNNRIIEKHIQSLNILPGLVSNVNFALSNPAILVAGTRALDPTVDQVKYFLIDEANNDAPINMNYSLRP